MSPNQGSALDAEEIRAGIDDRVRAVGTRDVDRLMSHYAADVVTFDVLGPLTRVGTGPVRKRLTEWFASFQTPIDYEVRDVSLAVAGDVAFDSQLTHVRGTNQDGAKINMWFRETLGYRKIEGRWKVVHQHSSAPFDASTGKAQLDLDPPS